MELCILVVSETKICVQQQTKKYTEYENKVKRTSPKLIILLFTIFIKHCINKLFEITISFSESQFTNLVLIQYLIKIQYFLLLMPDTADQGKK